MGKNGLVFELKHGVLPSTNHVLIERGMNLTERRVICTSSQIPLREKLFFRIIYEKTFRPFEAQHLRIEDWELATREVTAKVTNLHILEYLQKLTIYVRRIKLIFT